MGCGLLMAADSDLIRGLGTQGHIAEVVGLCLASSPGPTQLFNVSR